MNKNLFLISFILFLNIQVSAQDVATELMQAYGGSCLTSGPNSRSAQAQAANFEAIAQSLMNNSACDGIRGALINFQKATADLNAYKKNGEIEELEGNVHDLELAISVEKKSSNDPTILAQMTSALAQAKVDLVSKRQSQDYKSKAGKTAAVRNLDAYLKPLFAQLSASKECTDKKPNLFGQILSQMMAVSSNILSGPSASYLLLGSSFLDSIVSYFKNKSTAEAIHNVNLARKSDAVGCSLEGIASTYCQARDVSDIAESQTEASACVDCQINPGLRILNQDLNAFMTWALDLSAGSPPTTSGQASDKKEGENFRSNYSNVSNDLQASVATQERTYNTAPEAEKKQALRNALDNVATLISKNTNDTQNCGSNGCTSIKGLFREEFSEDPSCGPYAYLAVGEMSCPRTTSTETCLACLIRTGKEPQSFDNMKERVVGLLGRTRIRVDREVAKTSQTDPVGVISKMRSPYGVGNRTPLDFLKNTSAYFGERLENSDVLKSSPALKQAIKEAKTKIDESIKIESSSKNYTSKELGDLAGRLIPDRDIFYISNNLNELVKQEFAAKAKEVTRGNDTLKALSEFSVNETLNQLLAVYSNLDQMSAQAEAAKDQTRVILQSLGSVFGDTLLERIKDLNDNESQKLAALFCVRGLLIPGFENNSDLKSLCQGKVYRSAVPGSNLALEFDKLANEKSREKRICSIFDFSRRSRIQNKKNVPQ